MIKWLKSLFAPKGGYTQRGHNERPNYPKPPAPPMPHLEGTTASIAIVTLCEKLI